LPENPRFKIDENLPPTLVKLLGDAEYEAHTVYIERLKGSPDDDVIARCKAEGLAIITCDKDFADIRAYPPSEFNGIIVLRPKMSDRASFHALVSKILPLFGSAELAGLLWVVTEHSLRIRSD
jgi:predicted nuclease of predicted toxin-antitoxin system